MPLTIDLGAELVYVVIDSGTVTVNTFVKAVSTTGGDINIVQAGLGDPAFGVSNDTDTAPAAIPVSRTFPVWATVTAAVTLAVGDLVMADADGNATLYDGNPAHTVIGKISIGGAAGDPVTVDSTDIGYNSVGFGDTFLERHDVHDHEGVVGVPAFPFAIWLQGSFYDMIQTCWLSAGCSVSMFTSSIPITLGAGDGISVNVQLPPMTGGTVTLDRVFLAVSNTTGTQKLTLADGFTGPGMGATLAYLPTSYDPHGLDPSGGSTWETVGTDLAWDAPNVRISSTAGGQFLGMARVDLTVSGLQKPA